VCKNGVELSSEQGNYYPFGAPMPGRTYIGASGYRYGMSGQEKDDEIDGSGNSIDFGDREYDPRLGRWFSVDKLFAKYPWQSPYSFVGNSPILNKENGGRDYGVYVDHDNHTITIKATFYTTQGDETSHNSAASATQFWNNQSGKYQYRVEAPDGKYTFYDVKFDIKTEETADPGSIKKEVTTITDYETGKLKGYDIVKKGGQEANLYSVKADDDKFFETGTADKKEVDNRGGLSVDSYNSAIKQAQAKTNANSHEEGHDLGAGHVPGTVMNSTVGGSTNEINGNVIKNILGNAGIGNTFNKSDAPLPGTGKVVDTKGTAPENFNSGKVVDK
jgi:RHS repeat-associated protein